MHISNFRKVKRVEDVAKAFEKIHDKIPSVLLFVGDGPERHAVEVLCRELKTCSKTKFLGKIKSVNKLLSIADLFILPSETESFGLAALEAMASGVPVISTNTGGLPEVNEHGVSGYMTSVGDIEGLAKYSIDILKDDAVLNTFKKNARLQAEKFDIKRVLPLYENIYQSLLDN
jgi:N-acetyl-alpha-D-glucosaminyl L-malate synthase BshA